jgi:2-phospho-L-lactate transferase/gluconeogenesis factor (CofD/UPF0052 family)
VDGSAFRLLRFPIFHTSPIILWNIITPYTEYLPKTKARLSTKEVFCMAKVGVEQSLTNITQALREKGYDVVELKQESDAQNCDCCVVTGLDSNMMGMQDTSTKGSVIDANGMSADEVCQQVESRLQ